MKLTKSQREHLLELISQGLKTDEINIRARNHNPPYQVTRQQVDWYRKSRSIELAAFIGASEHRALKSGLALKEARVRRLDALGQRLGDEILGDRLWLKDSKMVGETLFEFEEFNLSGVKAFLAVLDRLAKEVVDRGRWADLVKDRCHQAFG